MREKTMSNDEAARPRRRSVAKLALGVLVLVAVLGSAAAGVFALVKSRPRAHTNLIKTFLVRPRDYTFSVTESGTLRAKNVKRYASKVKERVSILFIVPEGTVVSAEDAKAGMVLVKLDSAGLDDKLMRQQISVESAASSLTKAREDLAMKLKENESKIQNAEREVRFATMDLQEYLGDDLAADTAVLSDLSQLRDSPRLGGAAQKRKKGLESDVELAGEKVARAVDKAAWTKRLFKKEYVTRNELRADELSVAAEHAAQEQARLAKELFLRYELPKEAERTVAAGEEKVLALERARSRARSEEAQAVAAQKSAETTHMLELEKLKLLRQQVENCTIRADQPGLVIYATSGGHRWRRTTPIDKGVQVHENQEILHLPDLSAIVADVPVPEAIVERIQKGQTCTITADALPDRQFSGAVETVGTLPQQQSWWSNVKVFNAIVRIEGHNAALRPGMSCKAEVQIATVHNAICLPVQCVTTLGPRRVCYVTTPEGAAEARDVETGALDHKYVEITKGLSAGDRVLLTPPLDAGPVEDEEEGTGEAGEQEPASAGPEARPEPRAEGADQPKEDAAKRVPDMAAAMQKLRDAGITPEMVAKWRTDGIPADQLKKLKAAGATDDMIRRFTQGGGGRRRTGRRPE